MAATLYLNLEDDIAKIVAKLKREKASEVVLVCPKGSFIFSDSINLRLLKKKVDLIGKAVSILTMDLQGQAYAKQAGFTIKHMPKARRPGAFSDIRPTRKVQIEDDVETESALEPTLSERIKKVVTKTIASQPRKIETLKPTVVQRSGPKPKRMLKPDARITSVSVAKAPVATVRGPDNVFSRVDSNEKAKPNKKQSRRGTVWIVGFVGICLITLLISVLFILPSADITVYGKSQTIARDVDISMDTKVEKPDPASLAMPAVPFDETPQATVTIETTGKKEIGSKAEGQVSIYNLTGQPLNLKAATTILTIGTKSYRFLEDQNNIRPATSATDDKNATIARVIAVEGGDSYNAPSQTRMEITNQAFGAQPQRLFAKASTQIIGGNSRYISVVSEDDIKKATEEAKEKLLQQVKDKLKDQNLTLLNEASTSTPGEFIPDKVAGIESPTITVQARFRITGLAFDESSLKEILRTRIFGSLNSGRKLQSPEEDTVVYKVKNLDVAGGTLSLSLHYESKAKLALDTDNLMSKILGKSKQETSEILLSNEAIERVEIYLKPSWQTNTPLFKRKINLIVKE